MCFSAAAAFHNIRNVVLRIETAKQVSFPHHAAEHNAPSAKFRKWMPSAFLRIPSPSSTWEKTIVVEFCINIVTTELGKRILGRGR
jgi:hypothetical protein